MPGALAALALVALVLGGCAEPAPEAAGGEELRFVQLNLCGHRNALPEGCLADDRTPDERVAGFVRFLVEVRPHVVTLNEACRDDVERLQAEVTAAGWRVEHVFDATAGGPWLACRSGAYGNAVLVHGSVEGDVRHRSLSTADSPEAVWERRGVVCADARIAGRRRRTTVCATHLTPPTFDAAEHERQLASLRAAMADERRRQVPLVLGGDLNAEPDEARALLRTVGLGDGAPGADRPTYGSRKYDYLFTTDDVGERLEVEARPVASSDHRALVLRLSSRLPSRG